MLNSGNGLSQSYLRGLDLSGTQQGVGGVGGLLAVRDQSPLNNQPSTHFAASDANGNVVILINAADGKESARYEYGPFAEPLRMTGAMAKANPIRFNSQYADDATGDLKYLYRDYSVGAGRWQSRDPIGEFENVRYASQQHVDLNLNAMLRNDSINNFDYLGLKPNCCSNPKPIDTTVAAHDAPGASRADKIPRNANVEQMLGHIANSVKSGECVRRLNISAHGNPEVIAIGGNDGDAPSPPFDPRGRVNRDISVEASNAERIGQRIKNLVCLCKPCEIYILSCHVGLGKIGQALANGSGCTVYAPNGFCCPNYKSPDKSEITPKDSHYPDYNPPGAGNCFVKFSPQ